eukprot:Hpha_TRINITY_DN11525_c0_g2::TRINITY_DN11525_c0_g2_i1::g.32225::m.32225/K13207/CUGBP, BRUNOL, CELF; CUG-BP- and ETR3-like factor
MAGKLFVGRLPYDATEPEIQQHFEQIGPLLEVSVMRDRATGQSKGCAWVNYVSEEHAAAAIQTFHGRVIFPNQKDGLAVSFGRGGGGGGATAAPVTTAVPPPPPAAAYGAQPQQRWGQPAAPPAPAPAWVGAQGGGSVVLGGGGVPVGGADVRVGNKGGRKLFVGRIPREATELDLQSWFAECGPIEECVVLRDKATGVGKCCAFVTFVNKEDARMACAAKHETMQHAGQKAPMQVRIAPGEEAQAMKLFVGQLPRSATMESITELFRPYGDLGEVALIKNKDDPTRPHKGACFVNFYDAKDAMQAVNALDNFQWEDKKICVRPADNAAAAGVAQTQYYPEQPAAQQPYPYQQPQQPAYAPQQAAPQQQYAPQPPTDEASKHAHAAQALDAIRDYAARTQVEAYNQQNTVLVRSLAMAESYLQGLISMHQQMSSGAGDPSDAFAPKRPRLQ